MDNFKIFVRKMLAKIKKHYIIAQQSNLALTILGFVMKALSFISHSCSSHGISHAGAAGWIILAL